MAQKRSFIIKLARSAVVVIAVLFIGLCLVLPVVGQEGDFPDQVGIEIGASVGMLLIPDIPSMTTFGVSGGAYIRPGVEIGLAYNHAGMSLLGIELASIDLIDGFLSVDISPKKRFGLLVRLGGSYLRSNVLGEGIGGFLLLAGLGARIAPIDMLELFAQYTARFKYGLLNAVEAGIRIRF